MHNRPLPEQTFPLFEKEEYRLIFPWQVGWYMRIYLVTDGILFPVVALISPKAIGGRCLKSESMLDALLQFTEGFNTSEAMDIVKGTHPEFAEQPFLALDIAEEGAIVKPINLFEWCMLRKFVPQFFQLPGSVKKTMESTYFLI